MDFTLNEDQQSLKDGAQRYLADRHDFETRRKRLAASAGTDRAIWREMADLGWTAILVPEEYGGLGWTMLDAAILLEELGRCLVTEPFLEGAVVSARLLALAGGDAAGAALSGIADGTVLIVPALLEAGGRYRYVQPAACARQEDTGFVLSGAKILAPGADGADALIVSASLDGDLALFLVPADVPGLSRTPVRVLDGSMAADITLTDTAVDACALLATGAQAKDVLTRVLDEAALGAGAIAVGSMEQAIAMTAEYLNTRQQFGQPLANFQVLQHRMADLFIQAAMAKSALYGGLAMIDAEASVRAEAASAARARIDRAAADVGNACIHLHGGMGMTCEYPVGHHYRRIVMLTRSYGDTEYHLDRFERLMLAGA